jgi:hypothetical protein
MTSSERWLDQLPTLGQLPPDQAAAKLREVGEDDLAAELVEASAQAPAAYGLLSRLRLRRDRAFRHTSHAIGYLPPAPGRQTEPLPIGHAGNLAPDESLRGARVKLSLDGLQVADYPGRGAHRVLFDFSAQNQVSAGSEQLHFNATYRAAEGEQAAVIGRPIFVGLQVGGEGLLLQCATVNVQNEADEAFLGFLETDAFKGGLKLATTLQPALVPLSAMAMALTKAIASRHRNVAVQAVELGLDFRAVPMGVRLAEGSYIAVQIPETLQRIWDWAEWVYEPTSGRIVNQANPNRLVPYNYFVVSVSRYDGP